MAGRENERRRRAQLRVGRRHGFVYVCRRPPRNPGTVSVAPDPDAAVGHRTRVKQRSVASGVAVRVASSRIGCFPVTRVIGSLDLRQLAARNAAGR